MFIKNVFRFKVSLVVAIFEHKTQAIGMSQHRWCSVQMGFRFLLPTIPHFSEIRTSFTPFHTQIEQKFKWIEQKYLRVEQNVESKIELNKIKLN